MAELELKIVGLAELKAMLNSLPDKLRRRALRNALAAGARIVRDEARSRAPVLSKPRRGRKPGTVRDAITVRTSKAAKRSGDVGVFVNVRPAKGALRGTNKPTDPYYWRWLEFGRAGQSADPSRAGIRGLIRFVRARKAKRAVAPMAPFAFMQTGAAKLPDALNKIEQVLGPMVQKLNNKGQEP